MDAMANWLCRLLAAIGAGGRKTEADVSYDPARKGQADGGTPGSGGTGSGVQLADPSRH